MTRPERPQAAREHCPHCGYALAGLPANARICPECGGELSAWAFALAASRRVARNSRARLALLISPGVGVMAGAAAVTSRRGIVLAAVALFVPLWAGAWVALYVSDDRTGVRRPLRALVLGLPLGLGYFLAVLAAALAIVYTITFALR